MKIHKLSTILYLPFVLIALGIIYISMNINRDFSIWILVPAIGISLVYVFANEVDKWWWFSNPQSLPQKMKDWLIQYSVFYNKLSLEDKIKFDNKLAMFIETNQFYIVGKEAEPLPYDIKGIVGHEAIKAMLLLDEDPYRNINRIVLYKHAFPSPSHQYLHTIETHEEDGVIIFSLEHLIPGLLSPNKYYNIALHGYIEMSTNKSLRQFLSTQHEITWSTLTEISGITESFIRSTIGLEEINKTTVVVVCYIVYSDKFQKKLPQINDQLDQIFTKMKEFL